jgi:hypothetical protein
MLPTKKLALAHIFSAEVVNHLASASRACAPSGLKGTKGLQKIGAARAWAVGLKQVEYRQKVCSANLRKLKHPRRVTRILHFESHILRYPYRKMA